MIEGYKVGNGVNMPLSKSDKQDQMCCTIANAHQREIDDESLDTPLPRTELDSHANMVVLGKHAFIFDLS